MGKHLQRDLDRIKKELLTAGLMVEKALNNSIESLIDRLPELAKAVIIGDRSIDQKENQIEEECLKVSGRDWACVWPGRSISDYRKRTPSQRDGHHGPQVTVVRMLRDLDWALERSRLFGDRSQSRGPRCSKTVTEGTRASPILSYCGH